jgi:hypothetical protein
MSAGGLSYDGLTTSRKVTLPEGKIKSTRHKVPYYSKKILVIGLPSVSTYMREV